MFWVRLKGSGCDDGDCGGAGGGVVSECKVEGIQRKAERERGFVLIQIWK